MRVLDKPEAEILVAAELHRIPEPHRACVMCAIAGKAYSTELIVRENDAAVCVLDRFASTRGHLVIITREHLTRPSDVSRRVHEQVQELVYDAAVTLERALAPVRVYVAQLGSPEARPMTFPHVHAHVVPIYETDDRAKPTRVFSWTHGVVVYEPSEANELVELLRSRWQSGRA